MPSKRYTGNSRQYGTAHNADEGRYEFIKTFKPLQWQIAPWQNRSSVLLLTGSAGGGKSRLAAEKLHAFCLKYKGSTALMLRKVRTSLTNSSLLFMQRQVIGTDPRVKHKPSAFRFEYKNGSILAYGGMKDDTQREHIRSIGQDGGVDIVWLEEAIQFYEDDFDELLPRMRGRAAPWTQIILTTNPDAPQHWIKLRLIDGGEAVVYISKASDNPHNPKSYHEQLAKVKGVMHSRLVQGKWVSASGIVFDTWADVYDATGDNGGNVTDEATYREGAGPVLWWVDDGYSGEVDKKTGLFKARAHPRVFLMVQKRPNGQFAVFAEDYAVKKLAPQHITEVLQICSDRNFPHPTIAVYDRAAASLGGDLAKAGLSRTYNTVPVEESITETRKMIALDENEFRRIIVSPECRHLRSEMNSYKRSPKTGRVIKEFDHGPDALRMGVWHDEFGSGSHDVDVESYQTVADAVKKEMEILVNKGGRVNVGDSVSSGQHSIDIAIYGDRHGQ